MTPISRMIAIEASRMRWYSLSVSVIAGATVIESPVCTPIGSRFSIEQTMTALSLRVAHDLELELLPAEHALLDEDRVHGRLIEPELHHAIEARARLYAMPPPRAAHRERRPQDRREPDLVDARARLLDRRHQPRLRARQADARHRLLEQLAILGHLDRLDGRAEQLDAVLLEHARLARGHREVEAGLAAERRQDRARASRVARTLSRTSTVSGSTYVASASSGSVMIVAGFELIRTTRRPSSRSALHACVPE